MRRSVVFSCFGIAAISTLILVGGLNAMPQSGAPQSDMISPTSKLEVIFFTMNGCPDTPKVKQLAASLQQKHQGSNIKIALYNLDDNATSRNKARQYQITTISSMAVIRGSHVHVFSIDGLSNSQIIGLINTQPALLPVVERLSDLNRDSLNQTQFS